MPNRRLLDSYGRVADDLRISVTDRCNFRCIYCMPAEGLKWLAREDILRYEEIVRLARIFVERYGVRTIRITGGEPLVRIKVEELIGMINSIGLPNKGLHRFLSEDLPQLAELRSLLADLEARGRELRTAWLLGQTEASRPQTG